MSLELSKKAAAVKPSSTLAITAKAKELKAQGKAIVYISHKMDEIYSLTDQITVFRDGCLIGSVATKDVTPE